MSFQNILITCIYIIMISSTVFSVLKETVNSPYYTSKRSSVRSWFFHTISVILCFLVINVSNTPTKEEELDMSVRIEEIANDLSESSKALSKIQSELETRIGFVENLKKEAEIAESVITLTEEQVNAVQSTLNKELDASGTRDFIRDVFLNIFFYILGSLPTIIRYLKNKNRRKVYKDGAVKEYSDEQIRQAIALIDALNSREN